MFCNKCGIKLDDRAEFCTSCGNKLPLKQQSVQYKEQNYAVKKKPKKKGAIIGACAALGVLLLGGAGGYLYYQYYTSPEQEMLRDLKAEKYEDAYEIYEDYFEDEDIPQELMTALASNLETAKAQFISGEKEYELTIEAINAVKNMNINELEEQVSDTLKYVNALNESRIAFELGNQYIEDKKYSDAITQFKLVIEDDADYATAQESLESAISSYRTEQLSEAAEKADSGEVDAAITILKSSLKVLENDPQITQQLQKYENQKLTDIKETALANAKSSADSGDLKTAVQGLEKLLKSYPDDSDIKNQYNAYVEQYVSNVVSQANALVDAKDYDGALQQLDAAMNVLPDNQTLSDRYNAINNAKPVPLNSIVMRNFDNFYAAENAVEDIDGKTYPANNLFITYDGYWFYSSTVECNLDKKYSKFTATLAPKNSFSEDGAIMVEIYGDNDTLLKSYKITQKTEAFGIEVNVSGVKWLKIKTSSIDGSGDRNVSVIIANGQLYKTAAENDNSAVTASEAAAKNSNAEIKDKTGIVATEKDDLNVRKSPSTEAEKIGTVEKGAIVNIISELDGWYAISFNNQTGYVSSEFIRLN